MRNKLIKSFKMNTPKLNSFGTLDNKYILLEKLNNDSETIIFKVLDNETNKLLEVGTVAAKDYKNCHEYWEAHIQLIKQLIKRYNNIALRRKL